MPIPSRHACRCDIEALQRKFTGFHGAPAYRAQPASRSRYLTRVAARASAAIDAMPPSHPKPHADARNPMKLAPVAFPNRPKRRSHMQRAWTFVSGKTQRAELPPPPIELGDTAQTRPAQGSSKASTRPKPSADAAPSRETNPFLVPPLVDTFRPPPPRQQQRQRPAAVAPVPRTNVSRQPRPTAATSRGPRHTLPARQAPASSAQQTPVAWRPSVRGVSVPIRAVAVAHDQSNAVGTLELTCTSTTLRLRFIQISSFNEGYVPYPATSSEQIEVPYEQVAKVSTDEDGLVHLVVDRSHTPFNRLVLAGLVHDQRYSHTMAAQTRHKIETRILQVAIGVWIPIALVLNVAMPSVSIGWRLGIAMSLAGLLATFRREIAIRLAMLGPKHRQVTAELINELRWRLPSGRVQLAEPLSSPSRQAEPDELQPDAIEVGSLKGLFATAGIVAGVSLIAILVGKNLLLSPRQTHPTDAWQRIASEPALAAPHRAGVSHSSSPKLPITKDIQPPAPLVPCSCARADSSLWASGVPRMSVLTRNRPGKTSFDHPSVYPEIAVVNNSSEDLKDIVMIVDFLLSPRNGHKQRVLGKKDLFWEGVLPPGKAVKWRVRGRGDDFNVTSFVQGRLGVDGVKPAPADGFYKLATSAHTPVVRVHGAKMLAYIGDKRTRKALRKLQAEHRPEQGPLLEEIERVSGPLRVCGIHVDREKAASSGGDELPVSACVFNAGVDPIEQPFVVATAKLGGRTSSERWTIPTTLSPNHGVLATGKVEAPPGDADDVTDAIVTMSASR